MNKKQNNKNQMNKITIILMFGLLTILIMGCEKKNITTSTPITPPNDLTSYSSQTIQYNDKGEIIIPQAYITQYGGLICNPQDPNYQTYGGYTIGSGMNGIIACPNNYGPVAIDINGAIAFIVAQNNEEFVVYNGQELSRFHHVSALKNVNGKLSYRARDTRRTDVFNNPDLPAEVEIFSGRILRYKNFGTTVGGIYEFNNQLVYTKSFRDSSCSSNTCWSIIINNTAGPSYDDIKLDSINYENGKIYYKAKLPQSNTWIDAVDIRLGG
jgi:hypothetical protein